MELAGQQSKITGRRRPVRRRAVRRWERGREGRSQVYKKIEIIYNASVVGKLIGVGIKRGPS